MTDNLIPGIRNAVRAVIIRDKSILLQHKVYESGRETYVLPGGGQELGESLTDALQRECEEEIGCRVQVRDLMFVADYFKPRTTTPPTIRHVLEFLFACTISNDYQPRNGPRPDKHQVSVHWVPLSMLKQINLVPADYVELLLQQESSITYVGHIK
jgi:ADP-ribose pyrophosphatase YjhB (NUDIX family)